MSIVNTLALESNRQIKIETSTESTENNIINDNNELNIEN